MHPYSIATILSLILQILSTTNYFYIILSYCHMICHMSYNTVILRTKRLLSSAWFNASIQYHTTILSWIHWYTIILQPIMTSIYYHVISYYSTMHTIIHHSMILSFCEPIIIIVITIIIITIVSIIIIMMIIMMTRKERRLKNTKEAADPWSTSHLHCPCFHHRCLLYTSPSPRD